MSRMPAVTGRQLIGALKRLGFEEIRIRGSHHYLRHRDGRSTVIPIHRGESIGRGLLAKILRDVDLSREKLEAHLHR